VISSAFSKSSFAFLTSADSLLLILFARFDFGSLPPYPFFYFPQQGPMCIY
jgi:hypothetical protein